MRENFPDLSIMSRDEQMDYIQEPNSASMRQYVASSPYAEMIVIDFLVGDPSPDVQAAVANRQDENTGKRNHRLSKSKHSQVTQSVALNPLSAPYTLADLEHSKDTLTVLYVRENPATPSEVAERLWTSN